ncbi:hypothetical protein PVAG01_00860 [Phlyctema vagabunda]|uniref:Microbial-type PARG catalytic domain-containing protein n=1 Tax=Phlyctema vagabunda TaxID=108571 RepID=A0ABR4PVJ1_9HELO
MSPSAPAGISTRRLSKSARAREANSIIKSDLPKLLRYSPKAQAGIENTELITYSEELALPRVRIIQSDTFDAVFNATPEDRVGVLNMANALQPGGGVLHGDTAQEETLCLRSSLYASISTQSYPLPEFGAIYSPDVLIFQGSTNTYTNEYLEQSDWSYVDVISCAAIDTPDTHVGEDGTQTFTYQEDRDAMETKIKLILQIARQKRITYLVLGAFGCGAFRNPIHDVAAIFKEAILGSEGVPSAAVGIEEIIFAIIDNGPNLKIFREVFGEDAAGEEDVSG